jgi:exo-beta-1,3-glucanase (GH17 family)
MEHVDEIPRFISSLASDAKLVDNHTTMFSYEIPMHNLTLGQLLERVEEVKHELQIRDYSVSQTSLEQIFITMAQEYLHPQVVVE